MAYELYSFSGSPYALRIELAMKIKGLAYVSHPIDLAKGEQKTPEYLALNPRGKVPVLKDGDTVICESLAILVYLDLKHPQPAFFGSSPVQTAHIWQRISELESYARTPLFETAMPFLLGHVGERVEAIQHSARKSHDELSQVENMLCGFDFLAGNALSAADIVYEPVVKIFLQVLECDEAVRLDLGFDDFDVLYPKIHAWLARMEALVEGR